MLEATSMSHGKQILAGKKLQVVFVSDIYEIAGCFWRNTGSFAVRSGIQTPQ